MKLRVEVKTAKTRWIEKMVAGINGATTGQGGSAEFRALVRKLQQGLDRSVPKRTTMMRRSPSDMLSQTPEENADVFCEFFEAQYKRKPTGKLSAADLLPQLPLFADAGRVSSRGEVRRAVKNAAAWKALLVNESVFAWIYEYTFRFFKHGRPPADWERQLLKIPEKKGDLSLPKNYRGIMVLEAAYKVIANTMQSRLSKISEALPHGCQCGFRAGRGGSDGKLNFFQALKSAVRRRGRCCST
jgi:hypothetical protein